MTEAQTILKMIEEVDLQSRDSLEALSNPLSEWLWKNIGDSWQIIAQSHILSVPENFLDLPHSDALVFLFSRDALKAIRPEGWLVDIITGLKSDAFYADATITKKGEALKGTLFTTRGGYLPTEELAELHAIIQAIEYERGQK